MKGKMERMGHVGVGGIGIEVGMGIESACWSRIEEEGRGVTLT